MDSYLVQVGPSCIHPTHDEVGANEPLVAEEHLLDQPAGYYVPDLSAHVKPVQLQLAADGSRGLITVGSSPGTVNIRCPAHKRYKLEEIVSQVCLHVVELLTVLASHNIPA